MGNKLEKENCPYIMFRVDSSLFTVNSANVMAIMEMPIVTVMPKTTNGVRGVFMYRDSAVPMFDLRSIFGKKTLDSEYLDFVNMLEQRKQDHYNWVAELNRSVKAHESFKLATDPHKCAFGKWYYDFKSENNAINHHMRKIEEPHRLLHEVALEAAECNQEHSKCTREKCLKVVLHDAEEVYAKTVIDLIEEAKEVMKDSYREMALVIEKSGKYYGLAVDEVLSVEEIEDSDKHEGTASTFENPLVAGIKKCSRYKDELIIELNENNLLRQFR